jgi:protein tyrosine phosphatase
MEEKVERTPEQEIEAAVLQLAAQYIGCDVADMKRQHAIAGFAETPSSIAEFWSFLLKKIDVIVSLDDVTCCTKLGDIIDVCVENWQCQSLKRDTEAWDGMREECFGMLGCLQQWQIL